MKFAVLSLAACAALAFSVGTASAQPRGHHHGYSHNHGYHHHNSYYRGYGGYRGYGYPSYGYGYNSGFGLNIIRPGFNLSIGNAYPYSGYGGFYSPYRYGGWGW